MRDRSHHSSLWIAILIDEDGSVTWIDRVYGDPEEALEEAGVEATEGQEIKLVQVALDWDTPAKWAEEVSHRVMAMVDGSEGPETLALADAVCETLRDYQPPSVSALADACGLAPKRED